MDRIDIPDGNTNFRKWNDVGNGWTEVDIPNVQDESCYLPGFTFSNISSTEAQISTRKWAYELGNPQNRTLSDPDRCIKTASESTTYTGSEVSYMGCKIKEDVASEYTNNKKCVKQVDLVPENSVKVIFTFNPKYVGGAWSNASGEIYVRDISISKNSSYGYIYGEKGRCIPFEYRNVTDFYGVAAYAQSKKNNVVTQAATTYIAFIPSYFVYYKTSDGSWAEVRDWKLSGSQNFTREDCSTDSSKKHCSFISRTVLATGDNPVISNHNGFGNVEIPSNATFSEMAVLITFTQKQVSSDTDASYYYKIFYQSTNKKPIDLGSRYFQPFANANYITTSYDTTNDLGYWVFATKQKITKVNDRGFYRCSKLKNICLYPFAYANRSQYENTIKEIGSLAFAGTAITGQRMSFTGGPTYEYKFIPSGVTEIQDGTFLECQNLTEINLQNITKIGQNAFQHTGLITVDCSKVTSFGKLAFYECTNLWGVKIKTDLEEIPESCFAKCDSLTTVTIDSLPSSKPSFSELIIPCKRLLASCFNKSLKNDNISIHLTNIEKIEEGVFCGINGNSVWISVNMSNWEKVQFGRKLQCASINPTDNKTYYTEYKYEQEYMPASGEETYSNRLTWLEWNVTEDGTFFEGFPIWIDGNWNIDSLSRHQTEWDITCSPQEYLDVRSIAYSYCQNLNTVTIPSTVKQIGESSFRNAHIKSLKIVDKIYDLRVAAFYNATIDNLQEVITSKKFIRSIEPFALYELKNTIAAGLEIFLPHIILGRAIRIHCGDNNMQYPKQKIGFNNSPYVIILSMNYPINFTICGSKNVPPNTYNFIQFSPVKNPNQWPLYKVKLIKGDDWEQAVGYANAPQRMPTFSKAAFEGALGLRVQDAQFTNFHGKQFDVPRKDCFNTYFTYYYDSNCVEYSDIKKYYFY